MNFLFLDAKRAIIEQSPAFIRVPEGDSIKITCLLKTEGEEEGVYLMRLHAADKKVVYVPKDGNKNTFDNFVGRIETSGPTKNLTITLQQLRPNDSDFYYCLGLMRDANFQTGKGTGTLVIVTGILLFSCCIYEKQRNEVKYKLINLKMGTKWRVWQMVKLSWFVVGTWNDHGRNEKGITPFPLPPPQHIHTPNHPVLVCHGEVTQNFVVPCSRQLSDSEDRDTQNEREHLANTGIRTIGLAITQLRAD